MNTGRTGYFGGSFDPPHMGHLAVAKAAAGEFELDRVLLAPTGHQPLKPNAAQATFADRLAMVELLCADEPGLQASDVDAPQPGGTPNYTVDTLHRLQTLPGGAAAFFVVVGADAFLDLRRWRSPDELLRLAEWIVVSRPGIDLHDFRALALTLTPQQRARVHVLDGVHMPESATEIRTLLAEGRSTGNMLTPLVQDYIRRHHLYGT